MKECSKSGCKFPRVFFNQAQDLKICLVCRMTYHSQLDFIKIPDSKIAMEAIDTISQWLQAIREHANSYNIEGYYKGFKGELGDFEQRKEEIRKRLKEIEDRDAVEEIEKIEKEVFDLKKQLDSSEMMRNFTFHRFQITMECASKGVITEEIKDDTHVKRLLTLAKENMIQSYERSYEEKYSKKNEELHEEYESKYKNQLEDNKTQIDQFKVKIEEQDTIIENHKSDITKFKEQTKEKDTKIDILEEDYQRSKAEIESIRNDESAIKMMLEYYKTKTGSSISDKFEDLNFCLALKNDAHKQVLSAAKLFKLPPIRKLYFEYCEEPNSDLLEFLKISSPSSSKLLTFGYNTTTNFKPIDFYVEGLEVALKGATQEIFMAYWTQSKDSLQRLIRAGAGVSRFIVRDSKIHLDEDLDLSGPDYKIQVR